LTDLDEVFTSYGCAIVIIRDTAQNKRCTDLIQNYLANGADLPVSKIFMEN